jgi:hypothetical protein
MARFSHVPTLPVLLAALTGCGDRSFPRDEPVDTGSGPAAMTEPAWTLIALPDTQAVVHDYPEILYAQTAWIAAQARALNIEYVVHEGDITNDSTEQQWDTADHAFRLLDHKVPYALAVGNHDYPGSGAVNSRDTSAFDARFPPGRVREQPGLLETFEPSSIANAVYGFQAGGQPWLILALEFGPRDAVLNWAARVLDARPGANAILVTHAFLFTDGMRFDHVNGSEQYSNPHDYDNGQLDGVNDAEEMWHKLIAPHPEIQLVLCGHMHAQARLSSPRAGGSFVHQLLADYQAEELGGAGYLRILGFLADGRITVRTYSPFLDRYRTDEQNQFVLD